MCVIEIRVALCRTVSVTLSDHVEVSLTVYGVISVHNRLSINSHLMQLIA